MATLSELYTMEDVAKHNTKEDCWVVIDGKVYDVSSYLDEHPGGDDVLLNASGNDATEDFEDAGHSKSARELLDKFCIGELDTPTPLIPQLEIVKKQQKNLSKKLMEMITKQYPSTISVAVVGIAVIVSVFYVRSRQ